MKNSAGVALITVLLVVFLAGITATSLASLQQINIRRSTLFAHQQQARLYALGAEQWTARILMRDRDGNDIDHLQEDWAVISPVLPVEGGFVSGHIEDLQARFNLNNLIREGAIDAAQLAILRRLLERLNLDPDLAQAVADWIDADQELRFPGGAEDGEYLHRGYLAANRSLLSITELRLIEGVDQEIFAVLSPFVTALPWFTPVNVNTAPAPVLAALADELDLERAADLLELRKDGAYNDIDSFVNAAHLQEAESLSREALTVNSRFFLMHVDVEVGEARIGLKSLLSRTASGQVFNYSRSFGDAI